MQVVASGLHTHAGLMVSDRESSPLRKQQADLRERSDRLTAAAFAAFLHTNEQGAPLQWTWDRCSFGPRLVKLASAMLLCPSIC